LYRIRTSSPNCNAVEIGDFASICYNFTGFQFTTEFGFFKVVLQMYMVFISKARH